MNRRRLVRAASLASSHLSISIRNGKRRREDCSTGYKKLSRPGEWWKGDGLHMKFINRWPKILLLFNKE